MNPKIDDGLSNNQRYRMRQQQKGLCWDCPRPAEPGRVRCLAHLRRTGRRAAGKKGVASGKAAGRARTRKAKQQFFRLRWNLLTRLN